MALTREQILGRPANIKEIEIDGLGTVLIKPFTGQDIKKFQAVKDASDLAVIGVVLGVCDEDGNRLFKDDESDKVAKSLEFKFIEQITRAVMAHSGMIDPKSQPVG